MPIRWTTQGFVLFSVDYENLPKGHTRDINCELKEDELGRVHVFGLSQRLLSLVDAS